MTKMADVALEGPVTSTLFFRNWIGRKGWEAGKLTMLQAIDVEKFAFLFVAF